MEALVRKKRNLESVLKTLKTYVDGLTEANSNLADLDCQIERLDKRDKELESLRDKISDHCDDTLYATMEPGFDAAFQKLLVMRTKLTSLQGKHLASNPRPAPQQQPVPTGSCDVKLPRLDLPKFNGDHLQWLSFHDLFTSLVHNNPRLTDGVQKMGLLLQSLDGSALDLVRSYAVTNSSYSEAWKTLTERYQHTRELVNSNRKRLLDQPNLKDEDPGNLRRLVDTSRECIRSLKLLKVSVNHRDAILNFIIGQKLDPESRRLWKLSMTDDTIPKFDTLMDFLEKRSKSLSVMSLTDQVVKLSTSSSSSSSSKPR